MRIRTNGYDDASQRCSEASQARSGRVGEIKKQTRPMGSIEPLQYVSEGGDEGSLDLSGSSNAATFSSAEIEVGESAVLSTDTSSSLSQSIAPS